MLPSSLPRIMTNNYRGKALKKVPMPLVPQVLEAKSSRTLRKMVTPPLRTDLVPTGLLWEGHLETGLPGTDHLRRDHLSAETGGRSDEINYNQMLQCDYPALENKQITNLSLQIQK